MLYEGFKAKVICGQHLTEEFDIKTGVKQGCILSPFLHREVVSRGGHDAFVRPSEGCADEKASVAGSYPANA